MRWYGKTPLETCARSADGPPLWIPSNWCSIMSLSGVHALKRREEMHTPPQQKKVTLRLPEPLLTKIDALAARFALSREATFRLILTAADEQQLAKGFRLTGTTPQD
jgi:hypothetical protein